jgi:hypothetical protein
LNYFSASTLAFVALFSRTISRSLAPVKRNVTIIALSLTFLKGLGFVATPLVILPSLDDFIGSIQQC